MDFQVHFPAEISSETGPECQCKSPQLTSEEKPKISALIMNCDHGGLLGCWVWAAGGEKGTC